jgi:hypothetical protein
LNAGHEPSGALSGGSRIKADFGQKARDTRRRGNVVSRWLGFGGGQPHELPAFPGIQSGADDADDIFQTDSWARSDKIRAIEGIQLTQ